uniref:Small ribosomal subunit protein bS18c n=1 Tax=Nephroselmis olivacea TaxID=31312 RepID=RR18_NEPOL|nr:ribosomal protein S18 [Nephroselmis olivacea]Q9TKX8.1 RecName: Full=Small ribosomal subunit protein bS18c; AltName: Full=30S ribosomal protein S18, chloroplastic [Nephroselmis olivacea]AAD54838.1 ribosomal protein S18 [Nephroselmis olivacea]
MIKFSRRRLAKLANAQIDDRIDYKNVDLLRQFLTEEGKILPRRVTGLTAKQQRGMTRAIKQARIMALLEFIHR